MLPGIGDPWPVIICPRAAHAHRLAHLVAAVHGAWTRLGYGFLYTLFPPRANPPKLQILLLTHPPRFLTPPPVSLPPPPFFNPPPPF